MGLNCGYACGIIGILKILTVVCTLVPTGLLFYATGNATYYDNEHGEGGCKKALEYASMVQGKKTEKSCPAKGLGYTAESIFAICFIVSLVCLIVLLCVKLNENGIFKQLDFIYHLGAGVAVIVAGILAIVFGALAITLVDCEKLTGEILIELCKHGITTGFRPVLFLAAGGIGLIGGIIYIFAACKLKKE